MSSNDVVVIQVDQTEFYRANVTWLLRAAHVRCGDRQWAEDLVQETFVRPNEQTLVRNERGYRPLSFHASAMWANLSAEVQAAGAAAFGRCRNAAIRTAATIQIAALMPMAT
jgi:hypothetical protein